jgi:hypothetical protein
MAEHNRVVIEIGQKKVFASAVDWPGWSRSAKTEEAALEELERYAERYQRVAELAGLERLPDDVEVIERLKGSGATDFGVPDRIAECEMEPMTDVEFERQVRLLRACWSVFEDVVSKVSAELRKGPRGGGRDRDQVFDHVVQSDRGYGRRIGVRTPPFDSFDVGTVRVHHEAIYVAIPLLRDRETDRATGWPARYFIRRAAWHVMDHAWEMEDKDLTAR